MKENKNELSKINFEAPSKISTFVLSQFQIFLIAALVIARMVNPAKVCAAPSDLPTFSLTIGSGILGNTLGVTSDSSGNIIVPDYTNRAVKVFDSAGNLTNQWGSYGSGNSQFNGPSGAAVDANGNIFVADTLNHRIQRFDSSGTYLSQWGVNGTGNGQFRSPRSVEISSAGIVYVADEGNARIQKFDSSGTYLGQWGSYGTGNGQFSLPRDLAFDSAGNIYVTDYSGNRVEKFDSSGNFLIAWGSFGTGDGQFQNPWGIAVDDSDYVFVADAQASRIQKFSSTGQYLASWGTLGLGNSQFFLPAGLFFKNHKLYIADKSNNRVQVYSVPVPAVSPTPTPTASATPTASNANSSEGSSGPSSPQIGVSSNFENLGGVFTAAEKRDSEELYQPSLAIIEPKTFKFEAFLSSLPALQKSQNSRESLTAINTGNDGILPHPLTGISPSQKTTTPPNIVTSGKFSHGDGFLGIKTNRGISWQVGSIRNIWFKAYSPGLKTDGAAKIIPTLQTKLSILALKYNDSDLIPPGQPQIRFKPEFLKLAHSSDGVKWNILSDSIVDVKNKTVAVLEKPDGYYMVVSQPL